MKFTFSSFNFFHQLSFPLYHLNFLFFLAKILFIYVVQNSVYQSVLMY